MLDVFLLSPHSDPQAELGEPDAGGQCLYEDQLAQALSFFDDVNITTFCRFTGERPELSVINDQYKIIRIKSGPDTFVPKEEIEPLLPEFIKKVSDHLTQQENKDSIKIAHGHYWDGAKAVLMLKQKLPYLATIWTPHSLGTMKRDSFPGIQQESKYQFLPRVIWENYMLYASQQVIVSTNQEKDIVVRDYHTDSDKVQIIPPGVDFSKLDLVEKTEARKKYNLPQEANILLCLGRMTPSKGYHYAIEVLSELKKKKLDHPTHLVICGGPEESQRKKSSDAEYRDELKKIAEAKGVADRVLFHPAIPHEEVKYMYRAADVFLMTSESEPFGLTLLEAMALNRPVVAFNKGGPTHLITHNRTGCLVKPRDSVQMAGYVTALLKDADYRSDIIAAAYHFVKQNFDWQVIAREFITVYEKANEILKDTDPFPHLVSSSYFLRHNLGIKE